MDTTMPWTPDPRHMMMAPAHPVPIVESCNMSATELPPLHSMPCAAVLQAGAEGILSSLQLETAAYAVQAMNQPGRAFFLGDATGVGKTRIALAVLLNSAVAAASRGVPFRALWVSVRNGLETDVRETLRLIDPGGIIAWQRVVSGGLNKKRKREPESSATLAFCTYSMLRHGVTADKTGATLSAMLEWIRGDHIPGPPGDARLEAAVVFDEAHVAKGPGTSTFRATCRLQSEAPCARVLYCTATAASDVVNLGYMQRLGLFATPGAPFETHAQCTRELRKSGMAALELVALHLKSRGLYVSRMLATPVGELSLHGPPIKIKLNSADLQLYRECCTRWAAINELQLHRQGLFSSYQQDFFLGLITSLKARALVSHVRDAVRDGWSVVISIQNVGGTGEGSCRRFMQHAGVDHSGLDLPADPLDTLILALHCAEGIGPVAELTGRRHRRERDQAGVIQTVHRAQGAVDSEVRAFQADTIRVAILSAAGGTGVSLHAVHANSPRRLHLLLQLPWSSEKFVQQCGRTHRTGERVPPLYRVVVADVPIDERVAHVVHQRLKQMGALTRGDRNSTDTMLVDGTNVSSDIMQAAGLETLLREACERAPVGPQRMQRKEAREILAIGTEWHNLAISRRASAVLENRLRMLDAAELYPGFPQYELNLASRVSELSRAADATRALLPQVRWKSWTRGNDQRASTRMRVSQLLRCAAADPERGFGMISGDIVNVIIDLALRDPWEMSATAVVAAFLRAGVTRSQISTGAGLISKLAAVPVQEQRCFWTAVTRLGNECEIVAPTADLTMDVDAMIVSTAGAMDIINHCYPRGVPRGCVARCVAAHHWAHPGTNPERPLADGHALFTIEIHPHPAATARGDAALKLALSHVDSNYSWDVPETAVPSRLPIILCSVSVNSGIRVVVPNTGPGSWDVEVWSAGSVGASACLTEDQWSVWALANLRPLPESLREPGSIQERWTNDQNVQHVRRLARCSSMRSELEVVLASHALHEWDRTCGTLVRAEPPLVPWSVVGAPLLPRARPW